MRITPLESDESKTLVQYLLHRRLCFLHIPNEGRRSWQTGRRLKAMGLRRGAPDYLIFNRTRNGHSGMAIELKRVKGGRTSDNQRLWLEELQRLGWVAAVAHGAGEAIEIIEREY